MGGWRSRVIPQLVFVGSAVACAVALLVLFIAALVSISMMVGCASKQPQTHTQSVEVFHPAVRPEPVVWKIQVKEKP